MVPAPCAVVAAALGAHRDRAVEHADTLADGWRLWLDLQRAVAPDSQTESMTLEADRGHHLGYIRVTARRRGEAELEDCCWPDTLRSSRDEYTRTPLLRGESPSPDAQRVSRASV